MPDGDADGFQPPADDATGAVVDGVDWMAVINAVPADKLRSHPRVAGIIGSELQTRTPKPAEQPAPNADGKGGDDAFKSIVSAFHKNLPEDVRTALSGKKYPGTREEGFNAYVQEAFSLARPKADPAESAAANAEARAAARQGESTPMIGSDGHPAQLPTRDQLKAMTPQQIIERKFSPDDLVRIQQNTG